MTELKPCPHCPRSMIDPVQCELSNRWQIFCGACGSSSGSYKTEAEAIVGWNKRSSEEKVEYYRTCIQEVVNIFSHVHHPHKDARGIRDGTMVVLNHILSHTYNLGGENAN